MSRKREIYLLDNKPVPIRWSAPEVLRQEHATTKSDVYSFGVVCWEVFEWGLPPYFEETENKLVARMVVRGEILPKPDNVPDELFELMKNCWKPLPSERPTFRNIVKQLILMKSLFRRERSTIRSEATTPVMMKASMVDEGPMRKESIVDDEVSVGSPINPYKITNKEYVHTDRL